MKAVEQVGTGTVLRRRPGIVKGELVSEKERVVGPFRGIEDWARWCVAVDGGSREAISLEGAGRRLLPVVPELLGPRWRRDRVEEIVGLSEAAWKERMAIRERYRDEMAEVEAEVRGGGTGGEVLAWVQGDAVRRRGGEWDRRQVGRVREAGRAVVAMETIGEEAIGGIGDGKLELERIGRGKVREWMELGGIAAERVAYGGWEPGARECLQAVVKKSGERVSDDEADEMEWRLERRLREVEEVLRSNWGGVERVKEMMESKGKRGRGEIVRVYRNRERELSLL